MRSMRVLAAVVLVIGAVNWAQAEPIEIKLGHINQPGSLIDIEMPGVRHSGRTRNWAIRPRWWFTMRRNWGTTRTRSTA